MNDTISVDKALTVTDNLVENATILADMDAKTQEQWLADASFALQNWGRAQDYTIMMEAQVLWTVYKAWGSDGDNGSLREEVKSPWDYDYYKWARMFTKRGTRRPANITILNKISVYRDWVAERNIDYPDTVFIPKRNVFGELEGPELIEEEDWEEVSFSPMDCDYSKLLIARGGARSGEMNDHAWTVLRDPFATAEDLSTTLKQGRDYVKSDSNEFRIYQDAGMFFAEEDGLACAFLTIVPESLSQKVGRKALARIKKVLGLPAGDESLDLVPVQIYDTASIEDDKLVICVGGVKFGVFGWEEVKKINNAILELRKKLEENGRIVKSVSTH